MSLNRRDTLIGLGIASGVLLSGQRAEALFAGDPAVRLFPGRQACPAIPQAAEGPFYNDVGIERTTISEGRAGLPLELVLKIVEAGKCLPLPDIRVDVWHADAAGCYSGFQGQGDERDVSTVGETFLRGTQRTDGRGQVRFNTVYPGWYAGRTPHIHVKLFADEKRPLDRQVYFPEDVSEIVFARAQPYSARQRRRDTFNRNDLVSSATGSGRESVCAVSAGSRRLIASLTIGMQTKRKAQTPSPASRRRPASASNSCRAPVVPGVDI